MDKVENNVIKTTLGWCVPITRKEVHLILTGGLSPLLYPGAELESLTTISLYSTTMLYTLIQSRKGKHTDQSCFEKDSKNNSIMRKLANSAENPNSFKIPVQENTKLHLKIAMDLTKSE